MADPIHPERITCPEHSPFMSFARYRAEWFGNIPRDLISGLFVALALIPEAISFAVIAGVDP